MKTLLLILAFAISAAAQTFPRWPANQQIKIYTLAGEFTDREHARINAAIESWRPLLPKGLTLTIAGDADKVQLYQGSITIMRKPVKRSEWAECKVLHDYDNMALFAVICVDRRAGSGEHFQHSVEHELGHALGLDHRPNSVMSAGQVKQRPSEADAAILRGLYAPVFCSLPLNVDYVLASGAPSERAYQPSVDVSVAAQQEIKGSSSSGERRCQSTRNASRY